ncbi:MAG: APH(3') family aminoglycoside O-phosphotransferase [Lachnospiraceae bacterium]|nr:APH(3') family aminoglycoside O-phosphotransferase [Lachnospiraceae bacterium]
MKNFYEILEKRFGIQPPGKDDQDWRWTCVDALQTEGYIGFYKEFRETMSEDQKETVIHMILQGMDDISRESGEKEEARWNALWDETQSILTGEKELHTPAILYWAAPKEPLEMAFSISKYLRDFCEQNGIDPDQDRKQLEMCWIVTDDPIEMNFPEGYTMENYAGEQDKAAWCECCREGMLIDENAGTTAFDASMTDGIVVDLYKDVFFLKHHGEIVGTVTAFVREDGNGELHMVSIRPEYRGKGLSRYLNAMGKQHLQKAGVKSVYLTTDEFREGAIKGYLSAGFLPVDVDVDMQDRWEGVLDSLGIVKTDLLEDDLSAANAIYYIPPGIRGQIGYKTYHIDSVGCSDSQVRIYEDFVLKIEKERPELAEMIELMQWLEGKLPVPKVIATEVSRGYRYLIMSKAEGHMACDIYYMEHPKELIPLLAETIKLLWKVDITDCPRRRTLETELKEARYRVEHDLVDVSDAEPDTFGAGGFRDPEELLRWLEANRPEAEPVFSHGDLCLPNVFFRDGKVSGMIDLGNAGVADKWRDIALCYRSLRHNADGTFGKYYPGIAPDDLFKELGIEPDWAKLRYYILLDELF